MIVSRSGILSASTFVIRQRFSHCLLGLDWARLDSNRPILAEDAVGLVPGVRG